MVISGYQVILNNKAITKGEEEIVYYFGNASKKVQNTINLIQFLYIAKSSIFSCLKYRYIIYYVYISIYLSVIYIYYIISLLVIFSIISLYHHVIINRVVTIKKLLYYFNSKLNTSI